MSSSAGPGADPDLFFFLSFAESNDTDDKLVSTFFGDLRDEVRAVAGTRRGDPAPTGFLSIANLRLGADWSAEIRAALGTCRVFVALCSPTYFASESCGKEWQAFADRITEHQRRTGTKPPALLPVYWRPVSIPATIDDRQYTDRSLSEIVSRVGLLRVMRPAKYQDDYHEFLPALAELIVNTARSHPLTPSSPGPDFSSLPRAFPDPPARPSVRPPTSTEHQEPSPPDLDRGNQIPRLHGI